MGRGIGCDIWYYHHNWRHFTPSAMKTLWFMVVGVGIIHVLVGLLVIAAPEALMVSSLAGLNRIAPVHDIPLAGIILCVIGFLAILAAAIPKITLPLRLAMVVPQQMVLLLQLWSVVITINTGSYPDGYTPLGGQCSFLFDWGSCFIFADQIAWLFLGLAHTWHIGRLIARPQEYLDSPDLAIHHR